MRDMGRRESKQKGERQMERRDREIGGETRERNGCERKGRDRGRDRGKGARERLCRS